MSSDISQKLAKFVCDTNLSDIPEEVIDFAKGLLLKTVAGMVVGSTMPSGRKLVNLIKMKKLTEDAVVLGSGFKTGLWESVLLNAFFAHASELEDDSFEGGVSWDITVIPLLFPLAQFLRSSGKNLLEALVLGLEVHSRTCSVATNQLGLVVVPGAVGPAAGAAKLMGLDETETQAAMGLALSSPAVTIFNFGTDAHYLESALQSLQGVVAAEMAKEKMTSNPLIEDYFIKLVGKENVNLEKMVEQLKEKWFFKNIGVKKYPCCYFNQRQIDVMLEIKNKYNLSIEDIEKVEVHASPADEPCNRGKPKNLGDLQFSFQHVLASAILDGDVNFSHFDESILKNSRYADAWRKIEVIIHPDWPNILMKAPAKIIVKTKKGKEISGERAYPIGSPQEPLSKDQYIKLFGKFTKNILSVPQIENAVQNLTNLENLADIGKISDILTYLLNSRT